MNKITIAAGPKNNPFVIPVLRCLWSCNGRDGVRWKCWKCVEIACWKSSALCAHLRVNGKSGKAHLCYDQPPHDSKHHPSVSSSLNWCRMAQNHSPWFSLSTASELPSLEKNSSTTQQPLAVTTCLSSPFPNGKLETKKVSKIYRRAAWKLLVVPIPHN